MKRTCRRVVCFKGDPLVCTLWVQWPAQYDEPCLMLTDLRRRFKNINDRYKREKSRRENPFGVIFWKCNRLGRDSIETTNIKTDLRLRAITIVDLVTSTNTGNAAVDALIEAF